MRSRSQQRSSFHFILPVHNSLFRRSDGLSVFIPDFNTLVDDSIAYFAPIRGAYGKGGRKVGREGGGKEGGDGNSSFSSLFGFSSCALLPFYPPFRTSNPPPPPCPSPALTPRSAVSPPLPLRFLFFFSSPDRPEHQIIPKFMCGESMGGAVAICIHRKQPDQWDGAIFMAPMCKCCLVNSSRVLLVSLFTCSLPYLPHQISAKVQPPAILVRLLKGLAYVIPTWQIVPSADIVTSAIRCPEKLKKIAASPYTYRARPRMRTALTMLHASQEAEAFLPSISLPFLLLHGDADIVTELDGSQALYDRARSEDKTLKVYEGAWHLLTEGEPEETAEAVLRDMIGWLDERSQRKAGE
ncbi:unnamed protein product [Closterium sp. Yama58-4]|nr:unnamed protein product [Closterium sp. Yama58-4]